MVFLPSKKLVVTASLGNLGAEVLTNLASESRKRDKILL
jgi:hypothetical protein